MARDWSELFVGGDPEAAVRAARSRSASGGLFRRLRESMGKTRQALGSEIQATLFGVLDEQTWERLEEALIMADVGARTTATVVETLESEVGSGELEGGEALSERLIALLAETAASARHDRHSRQADGDHGRRRQRDGQDDDDRQARLASAQGARLRVLLGAADTFRAAAAEQLEGWAERAGCAIVTGARARIPARSP